MLSYNFSLFLLLCMFQEDFSFLHWDSPSDYLCKKAPRTLATVTLFQSGFSSHCRRVRDWQEQLHSIGKEAALSREALLTGSLHPHSGFSALWGFYSVTLNSYSERFLCFTNIKSILKSNICT